ncbi:MAG TPA: ABC transporter substrate-binding protein, partial [Verrucomicrobiae bacterium]|nr:ABC transporter substrate-binding protein [Verrucomicrobiae bacterium]
PSGPAPTSTASLAIPRPPPGKMFRVTMAYLAPEQAIDSCLDGLLAGLKELGFEEQKNLVITKTHAQGEMVNIPALMLNLDQSDADLLVTFTTPILQGACFRVKHKPVVFTCVTDPIAGGAGKTWEDHVPHVTGVGSFPPLEATMDLLPRLLPGLKTIGTLYNSGEANSTKIVTVLRELAAKKGMELVELTAATSGEMMQAAQGLVARRVNAIYIPSDNTAYQALEGILKVAASARIPVINDDAEYLPRGVLASMGPGYFESGKATAPFVARVLMGESPAGIPMTNVSVNVTALNQEVTRKLGLAIPPDVLREIESPARPVPAQAMAAPLAKMWKVHLLELNDVPAVEDSRRGVLAGLAEAGLVEGRDYQIKLMNAQGDVPTLGVMVDSALSEQSDMLVAISTLSLQTALKKVRDRPLIFAQVTDPVKAGAGKSATDHLPNVTGSTPVSDHEKMIKVIRECLPGVKKIGTLFNPSEDNSLIQKDGLIEAATRAGIQVEALAVNQSAEMPNAGIALCGKGIDALCQISDNLTSSGFPTLVKAARTARLPLFCYQTPQAEAGGTIAVARDFLDAGRVAGGLAARVMRGENPGSIPFAMVARTQLILNTREANTLQLRLPDSLLRQADGVIDDTGLHAKTGAQAPGKAKP